MERWENETESGTAILTEDKVKGDTPRIRKVRARMGSVYFVVINLEICNTDMGEYADAAEYINGILEDGSISY